MGGEGNVGKISVTGDRVILQTVPNETKYILKNYAWGKTFHHSFHPGAQHICMYVQKFNEKKVICTTVWSKRERKEK